MLPPPPWYPLQQQEFLLVQQTQQQQQQDLNLVDELKKQQQQLNTSTFEDIQHRDFTFHEELTEQIDLFEQPQELNIVEENQRPHEFNLGEGLLQQSKQRFKPLQQRQQLPPPVAFVLPQLPEKQKKKITTISRYHRRTNQSSTPLESTVIEGIPQISDEELLRQHGIIDCSILIEHMVDEDVIEIESVFVPIVAARRKRKVTRDPTYRPSKRIRQQSVGWSETRELRHLPMREIKNLRNDIDTINGWEAQN